MERTFFMSYARSDAAFALKLAQDLRAAGVRLWIDQVDIRTGDAWDQAVEKALRSSAGVVVVLSPRAVTSQSVLDEISFALEENKRVVPVLSEPCDVPLRLRRLQRADAISDYEEAVRQLGSQLLDNDPITPSPAGPSESGTHRRSRGGVVPAVVFGAMGAGVAAAATVAIFAHDQRFTGQLASESIAQAAIIAGATAGLLWGAVGAIAKKRRSIIAAAVVSSSVVMIAWILVGGTYQDVLWVAVAFGWPTSAVVAGSVASLVQSRHKRRRSG